MNRRRLRSARRVGVSTERRVDHWLLTYERGEHRHPQRHHDVFAVGATRKLVT